MDYLEEIGSRIKMYRKLRDLTQDDLASLIYKSKPQLSKYECGKTAVDIETLHRIASVLNVDISDLLYIPEEKNISLSNHRYGIFQHSRLYSLMYFKSKGFHKGTLFLQDEETGGVRATLYNQIPNWEEYTKCTDIYTGSLHSFHTNAYLYLEHQYDPSDYCGIYLGFYRGIPNTCMGISVQVNYTTSHPCAGKIIFSNKPIPESDKILNYLTIQKNDLNKLRRYGLLSIPDYIVEREL